MNNEILRGLNDQQRCAVTSPSNVLQVLAPPGSGKTKTLTARVAYHIAHQGLKPWNMIVCTFTIKAAREMKERIRSFVGEELEKKLVLGTFHSVARRYLSTYGQFIGLPKQFGIADSNDSLAIIKRIIKKNDYSIEPRVARSRISKRKSGESKSKSTKAPLGFEQQEFEAIFHAYEEELQLEKLLDYDDLLLRCVELLTKHPECVSNVQAVLIDEFQDTNHVQYDLMTLFAQHRKPDPQRRIPSITIVGDPDQSIYSFRSAEIENLNRMRNRYPDNQVVHLVDNYRSSGLILRAAKAVIEQDIARPKKPLQATHAAGQTPVLRLLPTAAKEAAWLVNELQRSHHLNAGLLTYSDYAILLRSASLSRHIETELGKSGVPYRMVGGHKFFDRVEVRILLDYLRVINQPEHNDALLRVVNVPSRKVGETTINELLAESQSRSRPLWNIIEAIAQGRYKTSVKISKQAREGLENFVGIIISSRKKLDSPHTSIGQLLAHVMQRTSYENFLKGKYKEDYEDRAANVDELVELAKSGKVFAEQEEALIQVDGVQQQPNSQDTPLEMLSIFLSNIALATDADKQDAENGGNQVVISTIHAAKGLEWPVVFIPALYQGSIPHSRAEDNDEERRLLYVGMTRAKALLYLSCPKKSSTSEYTTLSPFVSSQEMSPFFQSRGSSFNWEVTLEIARILRRPCPSESEVIDVLSILDDHSNLNIRREDDYYPEDGEELYEQNTSLISRSASRDFSITNNQMSKRRKIEHSTTTSVIQVETTMTSVGFMSARQHMGEIKPIGSLLERSHDTVEDKQKPSAAKPIQIKKKLGAGQPSIQSFFGKPASAIAPQTQAAVAAISSTLNYSRDRFALPATSHQATPRESQPSSALDAGLKRPVNNTFRPPRRQNADDNEDSGRYVLLSSSPVRPDPETGAKQIERGLGKENAIISSNEENKYGITVKQNSLHETSMDRLASSRRLNHAVKRPLLQRPTGKGFVNKPFMRPTMRPS